jgi:class 3 adenylate cyclase/tetratricopeptide (TPR) repeat protein
MTSSAPSMSGPPEGAAELRLVSVLFVDLVGFTSLSEQRDAEDVRDLLGGYFDSARTIVDRYGGRTEKFIGDAVMAVWGAPTAREDDAERAVRAGLEIVDAVAGFGERVGAANLRARAGVVTGQAAAMDNPGEGLVVGDRVNTAARIQSAAEPGTVLVDEVTRQVTSAAVAYEPAGDHAVKGKSEPLALWRAVRVVAGVGGREREPAMEAPLVGREADLRRLKELLHAAAERRSARLVAVSAEAGLGKTRLRWELSRYLDGLAETFLWHSGRCLSYGDGVAYWALAEMVRQRLGISEDAPAEEVAARLEAGLAHWIDEPGDREFLSPRLGALLGAVEPGLGRPELFAGWRLFFERLAERDPVVMVFEDLQWADEGLLEFIEHVLEWSSSSPIFILTLARPELTARSDAWPTQRRGNTFLQLEPLDEQAMGRLLDSLIDGLGDDARDRIVRQAEGVPLYAIEMVRSLVDHGVVTEHDGHRVLTQELGELDVPASLGSLLSARIDSLEPEERSLVKAMSVFGGSFPRSAAAALGALGDDRLDAILARLVHKQVLMIRADPLSPDQGQYAFAQGMLRTVAYEMLSRGERKTRHRAAAEHLRRTFPNDGEEVVEVIAAHYSDALSAARDDPDGAELRSETVAALRRAGQRAANVGAPDAARRSYLAAHQLEPDEAKRAALIEAAGAAAYLDAQLDAALELYEQAIAAHRQAGRKREEARVIGETGRVMARLGRNEQAARQITAALDTLGPDELDPEVAGLHLALGRTLFNAGKTDASGAALERALMIAEALELPQPMSAALETKATMFGITGRVHEALGLFGAAIEIAEQHGLIDELYTARANHANLAMQFDLPGAVQEFEITRAGSRRRGARFGEAIDTGNLMALHLLAGRWDELDRLAGEGLTNHEDEPHVVYIHSILVLVRSFRGELDPARDSLERIAGWEQGDYFELYADRAAMEARVRMAEGRSEAALAIGLSILPRSIETFGPAHESVRHAWPDTLQAALDLGRAQTAREVVSLLADQPPGHVPPYLRAQLARGRALTNWAAGEPSEVEADLTAAIDGLRALGYPYWLACAQSDLAAWLIEQGRTDEAGVLLSEAVGTLDRLGAAPALERARALQDLSSRAIAG